MVGSSSNRTNQFLNSIKAHMSRISICSVAPKRAVIKHVSKANLVCFTNNIHPLDLIFYLVMQFKKKNLCDLIRSIGVRDPNHNAIASRISRMHLIRVGGGLIRVEANTHTVNLRVRKLLSLPIRETASFGTSKAHLINDNILIRFDRISAV